LTLNVIVTPPIALNPLLVVPVNVMELDVKELSPKLPDWSAPEFEVTLLIVVVKPFICMTKVPVAESVLPKNVKLTWLAVMATEPDMPEPPQLSLFGPIQNPWAAGKGPPSGVIVTVPVSDVLKFTWLPRLAGFTVTGKAEEGLLLKFESPL